MPLSHPPGNAWCDFGETLEVIGGVQQKAHCLIHDRTHSNGCFVKAYPAGSTEAFLDGHVSAFAFLGGILRSMLYDSTVWRWPRCWATVNASAPGPYTEL